MRAAAEDGHDEVLRRVAHAIKGACGMMGATELRGLAEAIEAVGLSRGTVEAVGTLDRFLAACERLEDILGSRWVTS